MKPRYHTLHSFIIVFYTMLLAFGPLACLAKEVEVPRLPSEIAPLGVVDGCVNIVSGSFFRTENEIEIASAEPLSWSRIYESGNLDEFEIGVGQGYNFPLYMLYFAKEYGNPLFRVENRRGAPSSFVKKLDIPSGIEARVHSGVYESGYCNLTFMEGGAHIKNTKVHYIGHGKYFSGGRYEVIYGNGTKRIYRPLGKQLGRLEREIRPSGNQILFEYNGWGSPIRIRATNAKESVTFSEISIRIPPMGR